MSSDNITGQHRDLSAMRQTGRRYWPKRTGKAKQKKTLLFGPVRSLPLGFLIPNELAGPGICFHVDESIYAPDHI